MERKKGLKFDEKYIFYADDARQWVTSRSEWCSDANIANPEERLDGCIR